MRRLSKLKIVLMAVVLIGLPVAATPAPVEAAGSTACYLVATRSDYKNWSSSALVSSDKGFRSLNSNYVYSLALRGNLVKLHDLAGDWYRFTPTKFGIKGESAGNSGGNPSGQALGASVTFTLYSTKTSASYGISIPIAVSYSWASNNTAKVITSRTNWESTALTAKAGVMGWANPFVGAAGISTGLYKISVRSSVYPGGDSGAYNAPTQSWTVAKRDYNTGLSQNPSPTFSGLSRINCSSIAWSN